MNYKLCTKCNYNKICQSEKQCKQCDEAFLEYQSGFIKNNLSYHDIFSNYGFQSNEFIQEYTTDFCNKFYKIIVFFYDNYWHCNPDIYPENYYHPELKIYAKDMWNIYEKRKKNFINSGYKVYEFWWDKDIPKQSSSIKKELIEEFLTSLNLKSNLIEKYKGSSTEEIISKLQKFDFAALMEHWNGDFNFSTMCRNANAFGACEVFYIGKKQWNKKGAVGTQHYTKVNFLQSLEDLKKLKEKYSFIGIDNIEGSVSVTNFNWPKNSLMIFGEENKGLTNDIIKMCDHIVEIPMYGSVRSLNAGTASGIIMHDYCTKNNKK